MYCECSPYAAKCHFSVGFSYTVVCCYSKVTLFNSMNSGIYFSELAGVAESDSLIQMQVLVRVHIQ